MKNKQKSREEKPLTRGFDPNLCLDDHFPNCGGTKTHSMLLSELLKISYVKEYIKQREEEIRKGVLEEVKEDE